ncbi:putative U3 small nucleolar RNA-associated protein 7 [Blastocladiella emersonii ATCC 22665]|nr:putative U3 small nucleolar RNA-associated protein 7 [Blastocladiella emersonii ATCC 22665]
MSARPSSGTKAVVVKEPLATKGATMGAGRTLSRGKGLAAARATAAAKAAAKEAREKRLDTKVLLTQDAGYLEAEEPMERTHKLAQDVLRDEHLDLTNQAKVFQLQLPEFGPYGALDFTRNGRHLLLGGKKGHVAAMDWKRGKLHCELHLGETVRDVCWLHNESMFAVAQKHAVYIYDNTGLEIHALRKHRNPQQLEYLPYHFLMASIGDPGIITYQDVSTGMVSGELSTKLGKCQVMTQNPWNAVLHCGHSNGTVTMWAPNSGVPLVKMLTHRGALTAMAVDPRGRHMATAGVDGQIKLWDLRNGFKPVHQYFSRAAVKDLSFSQRGLLAVGWGTHTTVWKDVAVPDAKAHAPYMTHTIGGGSQAARVQFVPFEDVLMYGHDGGVGTMVVPGAGEPNYDALEANPYANYKQRREAEVKQLLDKLPADSISLDPNAIGALVTAKDGRAAHLPGSREREAPAPLDDEPADNEDEATKQRREKREKNTTSGIKKYLRKQTNVIDAKKAKLRADMERKQRQRDRGASAEDAAGNPLARFRAPALAKKP